MHLKDLKKYLEAKDQVFLRDEILTLYQTFSVVREYYDPRIDSQNSHQIIKKYKAILEKQFCPLKGLPSLKHSIARKAISDFKKVCRDPFSIIDLQLTYVEYGIKCTLQYGDIDERFYISMENMFHVVLQNMKKQGLLEAFKRRCQIIQKETEDLGWGFGDVVSDLYNQYF